MMKSTHNKRGFTMIELLVSMGVIGVLAGIVVTAVNPQRQLVVANDAKREVAEREVEKALQRYIVDQPGQETMIETIPETEVPICRPGAVLNPGEECFRLDFLEEYLSEIPVDVAEPDDSNYTGFTIQKDPNNWLTVVASHKGQGSGQGGGSCAFGGAGTPENPITLCTCDELQAVDSNLTAHYKLGRNINCSMTVSWNGGAGFVPIGTQPVAPSNWAPGQFEGTLDGNGKSITGLTINRPTEDYVGLFVFADSENAVRNIRLENISITGRDNVGGLAAGASFNSLENVYIEGDVTGNDHVGGAVSIGTVSNVTTDVTVTGNDMVGGVSAELVEYDMENAEAHGDVTGNESVGGLAGFSNEAAIVRSFATGNVTGTFKVGGVLGSSTLGAVVSNSYATGDVQGGDNVGGLVGELFLSGITSSYATGNVSGESRIGGLLGAMYIGSVKNSFATGGVTGTEQSVGGVIGNDFNFSSEHDTMYWNNTAQNPDHCFFNEQTMSNDNANCTSVSDAIAQFYSQTLDVYDTGENPWDFTIVWQANGGALPTLR